MTPLFRDMGAKGKGKTKYPLKELTLLCQIQQIWLHTVRKVSFLFSVVIVFSTDVPEILIRFAACGTHYVSYLHSQEP